MAIGNVYFHALEVLCIVNGNQAPKFMVFFVLNL
jgi:hypothetical protein